MAERVEPVAGWSSAAWGVGLGGMVGLVPGASMGLEIGVVTDCGGVELALGTAVGLGVRGWFWLSIGC